MQSRSIFCMHYLDSYSGALELQSWRLPIQIKPDYAHSDPIPFLCLDPHSIVLNPSGRIHFYPHEASTATANEPFHVPSDDLITYCTTSTRSSFAGAWKTDTQSIQCRIRIHNAFTLVSVDEILAYKTLDTFMQ
eukprot:750063_1